MHSHLQLQKGVNGTCADDTKGMKGAIIDWITPKGQILNPHIPHNVKCGRGFTSGKCKGPDITSQTLQGHAIMVQVDNYLDKIIFADQASIMNDDLMPERWFNVEAI